jgi:hypothetical protein
MTRTYGRRKIDLTETQSHTVHGMRVRLVPFHPRYSILKVTTNMDLKDALSFSLGHWNFDPLILRRVAASGAPFFYVIRKALPTDAGLDTHRLDPKRDSVWSINL